MSDLAQAFFGGVALGGVIGALVVAAYAWDFGFVAGETAEKRRRSLAETALADSIQQVL